jgi:CheY-like chemotaxis protein
MKGALMQAVPILLVEDDQIDTLAVQLALKRGDIDNPLHTACDGVEALEMLTGRNGREKLPQPCLLLLDINMPRMNGLELLREMRGDDAMRRTVVFILTTSSLDEDRKAAYDLNVAGYFLKDDLDQLPPLLHRYHRINNFPDMPDLQ